MDLKNSNEIASRPRVLVAITGASGSIYAESLIEHLVQKLNRVYIILSEAAEKVAKFELSGNEIYSNSALKKILKDPKSLSTQQKEIIRIFNQDDLFAPVASGSSVPDAMVIVPCSMGTLGRLASCASSNLIERSADVVLKQRKKLIICPRETPLHSLHLRNMLTLSDLGAIIVPPSPAFYQHPKTIEDMVEFVTGRILELLEIEHQIYKPWNHRLR